MLRGMMDRLPRFSISFTRSKPRMITAPTATLVRKLVKQGNLEKQPKIRYHRIQQHEQDDSVSFRCRSGNTKKAVSWASSTVDNESTPKKSFQKEKEYYFSRVFELNREAYVGVTPGSMQMKLVKRM